MAGISRGLRKQIEHGPLSIRVEFYAGSTLIGSDTREPYRFVWANVPAGTYVLRAQSTTTAR